jgi:hypothetical protein
VRVLLCIARARVSTEYLRISIQIIWPGDGGREEHVLIFSAAEKRRSINWRELLGIVRVCQLGGERLRGKTVLIESDNMAAVVATRKMSSKAADMQVIVTRRPGIVDLPHTRRMEAPRWPTESRPPAATSAQQQRCSVPGVTQRAGVASTNVLVAEEHDERLARAHAVCGARIRAEYGTSEACGARVQSVLGSGRPYRAPACGAKGCRGVLVAGE